MAADLINFSPYHVIQEPLLSFDPVDASQQAFQRSSRPRRTRSVFGSQLA